MYEDPEQSFRNIRAKYSLATTWSPDIRQIIRCIEFVLLNGYSPPTVRAYISGISFKLKTHGNEDITKSFIITNMLDGCDRLYKTQDVMQPITFEILQKLHNALHHVCTSRYEMVLFQTAFCISFAAFLRVGEMSLTSNSSIDRIIQKEDIFVKHESNQLFIKVKCSKTDQRGRLTTLVVESNPLHNICPLNTLEKYLQLRQKASGPLFCHLNGSPLAMYQL